MEIFDNIWKYRRNSSYSMSNNFLNTNYSRLMLLRFIVEFKVKRKLDTCPL